MIGDPTQTGTARRLNGGRTIPLVDERPPFGLEAVSDASAVAWFAKRLWPWTYSPKVGEVIPEGFERYGRLLHPAYDQGAPVRWSRIAQWSGRQLHPTVSFDDLATREDGEQWSSGDSSPAEDLDPSLCAYLADILAKFTSAPHRCWFCVWSGYGGMQLPQPEIEITPQITRWGRTYFLFRGPVGAITALTFAEGPEWRPISPELDEPDDEVRLEALSPYFQSPNFWWPEDRAWFVSTEVDGPSTYVGGSAQLIERLRADPELEVLPASLEDPFEGVRQEGIP